MNLVGVILLALVAAVVFALLGGWAFMLLIGAAHSYDAAIPAFGFMPSVFIAAALRAATAGTGSASSN